MDGNKFTGHGQQREEAPPLHEQLDGDDIGEEEKGSGKGREKGEQERPRKLGGDKNGVEKQEEEEEAEEEDQEEEEEGDGGGESRGEEFKGKEGGLIGIMPLEKHGFFSTGGSAYYSKGREPQEEVLKEVGEREGKAETHREQKVQQDRDDSRNLQANTAPSSKKPSLQSVPQMHMYHQQQTDQHPHATSKGGGEWHQYQQYNDPSTSTQFPHFRTFLRNHPSQALSSQQEPHAAGAVPVLKQKSSSSISSTSVPVSSTTNDASSSSTALSPNSVAAIEFLPHMQQTQQILSQQQHLHPQPQPPISTPLSPFPSAEAAASIPSFYPYSYSNPYAYSYPYSYPYPYSHTNANAFPPTFPDRSSQYAYSYPNALTNSQYHSSIPGVHAASQTQDSRMGTKQPLPESQKQLEMPMQVQMQMQMQMQPQHHQQLHGLPNHPIYSYTYQQPSIPTSQCYNPNNYTYNYHYEYTNPATSTATLPQSVYPFASSSSSSLSAFGTRHKGVKRSLPTSSSTGESRSEGVTGKSLQSHGDEEQGGDGYYYDDDDDEEGEDDDEEEEEEEEEEGEGYGLEQAESSSTTSAFTAQGTYYSRQSKKPRKWSSNEDDFLRHAVSVHGPRNWKLIAEMVPGRSHVQCLQRWKKALDPEVEKGSWSKEEDALLLAQVAKGSNKNWGYVAKQIRGRTAKQCRERYMNHLRPDLRKGRWSTEEDRMLIEKHRKIGNRWAQLARELGTGRSENSVKVRIKTISKYPEFQDISDASNSSGFLHKQ